MKHVNILGFVGGSILSATVLPQIYKSWKTKSTRDISWMTILLNMCGGVLYGIYGILIHSVPVWSTVAFSFTANVLLACMKMRYDGFGESVPPPV